jgi:hypothetical protein
MTLSEMVIDLKNMIGPAGRGSEVENSGLKVWLQEAYADTVDLITSVNPDYFVKVSTTSALQNQSEYALPSDFEKAIAVNINYSGDTDGWVTVVPLQNINLIPTYSSSDSRFTTAAPRYYLLGNVIGVLPAPTAAGDNNIKIVYSCLKAELGDNSSPALPRRFHYKLKYLAYANYLDQNDEHVAAERMRMRFETDVLRHAESLAKRNVDVPDSVLITDGADMYTTEDYI